VDLRLPPGAVDLDDPLIWVDEDGEPGAVGEVDANLGTELGK
jgi:hypothetical protein